MPFAQIVLQGNIRPTLAMTNWLIASTAARASTRLPWEQFPKAPAPAASQVAATTHFLA